MSGLRDADVEALRDAIDRDETEPGDYNTTEHAIAAVEAIVTRAVNEALTEAADDFEQEQRATARREQRIAPHAEACAWLRRRARRTT